jgi:nucleoside 2-deoxyribosyltransferase
LSPYDLERRILLVGEVFVDQHRDHGLIRLGGVFHAARALHACGVNYGVAYVAPSYLDGSCAKFLSELRATFLKVGDVTGAPNVMQITRSGEAGDQGYDDLLRIDRQVAWNSSALSSIVNAFHPTDALLMAGAFPIADALETLHPTGCQLHVDVDHVDDLSAIAHRPHTLFASTSGQPFRALPKPDIGLLRGALTSTGATTLILKENRGGARAYAQDSEAGWEAPAFPTSTLHSVGVGDCFNAVWVASKADDSPTQRLRRASYIASSYASTFSHDEFCSEVQAACSLEDDIEAMHGVRVPWEFRPSVSIYLAAPDFPDVDTSVLDELESALKYHNFRPRRPIKENGLGQANMSPASRRELYARDIQLMADCALLIALPLTVDPGTFCELGWFAATGKPTILFDPRRQTTNLFAANVARRYCTNLTAVIDNTFDLVGRA